MELKYTEGQTPIEEDEKHGLKIKSISTMEELDEFEQKNIENAMQWALGRTFKPEELLDVSFILKLHLRMFNGVWKWAGEIRHSNRNIGVPYYQIRQELQKLIEDCTFWSQNGTFPPEEIAVRFKHRLVSIHPFPNGNGRHSRLMGDILLVSLTGGKPFTWGGRSLKRGEDRKTYLNALKKADAGDLAPLLEFARG